MSKLNIGCFAVFCGNRQLRVFHKAPYYDAYQKAVEFADHNSQAGYKCTVEEFSFSAVIGTLIYSTI